MPNNQQSISEEESPMDFLTPEQRTEAIAEIFSDIALRIVTKNHDSKNAH